VAFAFPSSVIARRPLARPLARVLTRLLALGAVAAAAGACDALGSIAVEAGDFAGAKADVHCDRRFVTEGGRPAAFCQEVLSTVAGAEFSDDCRAKHKATAGAGPCPRASVIAGCKLRKANDDDSSVFDWYYDVAGIAAEAGVPASSIDSRAESMEDVREMCADPSRYEEGADLAPP